MMHGGTTIPAATTTTTIPATTTTAPTIVTPGLCPLAFHGLSLELVRLRQHCLYRVFRLVLHKPKPARAAGLPVCDDGGRVQLAELFKVCAENLRLAIDGQAADKDLLCTHGWPIATSAAVLA
eukprot:TRINITY_DN633_c0_g2_i1.p5 TRINITY_DN633_c0_g2~~TRINITY_DN633_c0_g2_i1.p5  ORF type:complete len:123 (-),score=14.52 TRINITY_DN633_c0_g2_i1:399-767(-)